MIRVSWNYFIPFIYIYKYIIPPTNQTQISLNPKSPSECLEIPINSPPSPIASRIYISSLATLQNPPFIHTHVCQYHHPWHCSLSVIRQQQQHARDSCNTAAGACIRAPARLRTRARKRLTTGAQMERRDKGYTRAPAEIDEKKRKEARRERRRIEGGEKRNEAARIVAVCTCIYIVGIE